MVGILLYIYLPLPSERKIIRKAFRRSTLPYYKMSIIRTAFRRQLRQLTTSSNHPDFNRVVKASSTATTTPTDAHQTIKQHLAQSKVVLYMKGLPSQPECGFSWKTVQILNAVGIPYKAHNVLVDAEIRSGIKSFSQWPTIPQLYINGEFIGGCDIVESMAKSGDLQKTLEDAGVHPATPPPSQ